MQHKTLSVTAAPFGGPNAARSSDRCVLRHSVQKRLGACIPLNVKKTVQLKYKPYCRGEPVKGGRKVGKRDSEGR